MVQSAADEKEEGLSQGMELARVEGQDEEGTHMA